MFEPRLPNRTTAGPTGSPCSVLVCSDSDSRLKNPGATETNSSRQPGWPRRCIHGVSARELSSTGRLSWLFSQFDFLSAPSKPSCSSLKAGEQNSKRLVQEIPKVGLDERFYNPAQKTAPTPLYIGQSWRNYGVLYSQKKSEHCNF